MIAISSFLTALECINVVFGQTSLAGLRSTRLLKGRVGEGRRQGTAQLTQIPGSAQGCGTFVINH